MKILHTHGKCGNEYAVKGKIGAYLCPFWTFKDCIAVEEIYLL